MKKKINFIVFYLLTILSVNSFSQNKIDTLTSTEIKCIKEVYQLVDVSNKDNTNLFTKNTKTNITFIEILMECISNKGLTAYKVSSEVGNEFYFISTEAEVLERIKFTENKQIENVNSYIIKEAWIYGHNDKLLQKQTIGICPIQKQTKNNEIYYKSLFWIYFPEAQKLLSEYQLVKTKNKIKNYDDFLFFQKYKSFDLAEKEAWTKYFSTENKITNDDRNESYKNRYVNFTYIPNFQFIPYCIFQNDPNQEIYTKNNKKVKQSEISYSKISYKRIFKNELDSSTIEYMPNLVNLETYKNYPLFYPEKPDLNYFNLIDLLINGVHNKGITVFRATSNDLDNEFNVILTESEFQENLGSRTEEIFTGDGENYLKVQISYNSSEIESFIIKEIEFYDKNNTLLSSEIIGLSPIRKYYRPDDIAQTHPLYKKVCWFYYPEIENYLSKYNISKKTCTENKSFLEYFENKEFSAVDLADTVVFPNMCYNYSDIYVNLSDKLNNKYSQNIIFDIIKPEENINKITDFKSAKVVYTNIESKDENLKLFYPEKPILAL